MGRFWPFQRYAQLRSSPMRQAGAGRARLFGAALAAALLAAPGAARADGCDFGDLWNAVDNTLTSLASGSCSAACEDEDSCYATGALTAALGVYAAAQGQGSVDNFCNQLNTTISDVNAIDSWLNAAHIDSGVASALGSAEDPISVAQCACDVEQGVGQLTSPLGACLVALYQWLSCNIPGVYCPCTPSPPQQVDCSQMYNYAPSSHPPTEVQQVTNGTLIVSPYGCSPTYCFCPSSMVLGTTPTNITSCPCDLCPSSWCPDWCNCSWDYSCQCPPNTTPAAPSGPLSQVCICNNTHLAAVPPDKGGPCPIPLTGIPCPQGQANFKGQCVPACASNQVRAPDGHCCDPSQVTSCGTCCPPGWQPNPTDGTCSTPIIQ